ncbi:MAG: hypothetical protein ACYSUC_12365 [Planctomycetota bacterium]|jgi:hypothetical protein
MFKILAILVVVWHNGEIERIPLASAEQCLALSAAIAPAVESADCFSLYDNASALLEERGA